LCAGTRVFVPSCTLFSVSCRIHTPHFIDHPHADYFRRFVGADVYCFSQRRPPSNILLDESCNGHRQTDVPIEAVCECTLRLLCRQARKRGKRIRGAELQRRSTPPTAHGPQKTERGGDDVAARGGDHVLWPSAALDGNSSLPRAVAVSGCVLSRLSETATNGHR
jgi:hypothetical protein